MKVLHLEFGRHVYGGALQVAYLLKGLSTAGQAESHCVYPEGSQLATHFPEGAATIGHPIPVGGELDFRLIFRLRRLIREIQPDVMHIHSRRGADLWGVLAARQSGTPYILTRRVDNADPRWLARWRTRRAAFVVGISSRICDVQRSSGVDPEKIRCILSTVDTDTFKPSTGRAYLDREAGIPAGQSVVGMIAQFIERKGHQVLMDAVPTILAEHPQTAFLLFGKGPLLEPLKAFVARQPWNDQVRFMGFRDDLPRLLPALDIVAHPAFMEGLGVSLLQASACGVPVVACEAGGIPEVIEEGVNGCLVQPGDPCALAAAIQSLLGDAERRKAMGRAGRRIAEERFSIERMTRAYDQLYRLAAKG